MPLAGTKKTSFTIMFWFRVHAHLFFDEDLSITNMKLFSYGSVVECEIRKDQGLLLVECLEPKSNKIIDLYLSDVPNIDSWLHLTLTYDGIGGSQLVLNTLGQNFVQGSDEAQFTLTSADR